MFGRATRDVSLENDRDNSITKKQVLYLLNSTAILNKIEQSKTIKKMADGASNKTVLIQRIYLQMLSRRATPEEVRSISSTTQKMTSKHAVAKELIWALLNSTEFLFNH